MDKTHMNSTRTVPQVVAVAGKGGTGKTTLTVVMVKLLTAMGLNLLAVDADPPVSLTYALGAEPDRTVGEMRARLIDDPEEKRRIGDRHMADVIREELLIETGDANLLILGQAEGAGCFCGLNELLKFGIESLSRRFDLTLIDCEAGIEQINRRVINSIDTLIMVSDPTIKGLRTAKHLKDIAEKHGVLEGFNTGLVLNRVGSDIEDLNQMAAGMDLDVWGAVPMDENVAAFDRSGRPTIELPENSPCIQAVRRLIHRIGFLANEEITGKF